MRVNANALIVDGDMVLLNHHDEPKSEGGIGIHFTLPGGKIEKGESAHEALKRECLEELGADIEIGDLAFAYEYVPEREGETLSRKQRTGLVFWARLMTPKDRLRPIHPDSDQIGILWTKISDLKKSPETRPFLLPEMHETLVWAIEHKMRAPFRSSP